jgi:hypothetical protein
MGTEREDPVASIRRRISAGRLPPRPTAYVYAGRGDSAICACCDDVIKAAEIQYDLDFPAREDEISSYAMHLHCFHLWRDAIEQLAREELSRRRLGAEPPTVNDS